MDTLLITFNHLGNTNAKYFKNWFIFEKWYNKKNPTDNPLILEILEIKHLYYYLSDNLQPLELKTIYLSDKEVNKIGNLQEWNNNVINQDKNYFNNFFKVCHCKQETK
jgi:hypothetical protein